MDIIITSLRNLKLALFSYYSYIAPPMSPWEGSFLSHDALSHIMTPVMQQRDSRLFIKIGFLTIFALWTMHVQKHSLLRFGKGAKTPVCEIWWLLVERIVIAKTHYRRAISTLILLFTIKSGFVQLLSITEHTGPSELHSTHIRSRIILKDSSWTPLEYLWMLINMFTLTVPCIISHFPLTSLLFS